MRTTTALLVSLALALGPAGKSAAQGSALPNERTKTTGTAKPSASTAGPRVAPDLQALARKAATLADAGGDELPEARRLLGNLRADARFEEQPPAFRSAGLGLAGFVEMSAGENASAAALFQQAIALQDTKPDFWYWLSWVQADDEQYDAAARSLATLFQRWPKRIDNIHDDHIWRIAVREGPAQPARAELLQAIFDSGWQREARGGASHFHYQLALIRAKQGDTEALRAIVPRISDPADMVRMLGDQRFDAVVDRNDPAFDLGTAAERRVKALQAQVRRAPDRLDTVAELQTTLLVVGRFQDVITLAEDVQGALAAAAKGTPPYRDMDNLAWVQNKHADALDGLGRFEESTRRLDAATGPDESGQANVNQTLNLASTYNSLGRPEDALATLARAGTNLSGYGSMVKASIEHSAHVRMGDAGAAAKALDFLRENRAAAELIYLDALVEAGNIDGAAAVLAEQLASADERAEALFNLQDFNQPPPKPGSETYRANWDKVEQHPVVLAAVDKVGRTFKVGLYWSQ